MDVDELVRTVYPPSSGPLVLRRLAVDADKVVGLEELAIAAHGDNPDVWDYANSRECARAISCLVVDIRRRLRQANLDLDVEAVRSRGYRLVTRKPRRQVTRAETVRWRDGIMARYAALMAEQPDLSISAARDILAAKSRRKLHYWTLYKWVKQAEQRSAT